MTKVSNDMIVLDIKQPGLFVDLPGLAPVRTPAKINISKLDISIVIRKLASLGVQEYHISREKEPEPIPAKVIVPQQESKEDVGSRLGRIEALLEKMMDNPQQVIVEKIISEPSKKTTKPKKKKSLEDEDTFIPNIQTDGLSLEGDSSLSVEESRDDANEAADMLKKLNGKKEIKSTI